jgi:hypothetical protein
MLGAFFDDSGTHANSEVVVMGGLIGNEFEWEAFATHWQETLDSPFEGAPKLPHFHLAECRSKNGLFRNWTQAQCDLVTKRFRDVIMNSSLVTIGVAINKRAWDKLVTADLNEELGKPIELCFVKCIEYALFLARTQEQPQQLFTLLDKGTAPDLKPLSTLYTHGPNYPDVQNVSFAPVNEVIGLQGADMVAYETYKYAIEWFKFGRDAQGSPHFQAFRFHHRSMGLVFDTAQIAEMVERARPPSNRQG